MKRILVLIWTLVSCSIILAQEPAEPVKVHIACGPYIQNVTDTSFTVIWTTDIDAVSWVELAPDDGTNWNNCERKKYYDRRGFGRRPITKIHHVTVKGLAPATRYRYRVMMEGVVAQYNRAGITFTPGYGLDTKRYPTSVTTKARNYDRLRIGVVNDMHEGDSCFRLLMKDAKMQKYDFVVFNGDMTSEISEEKDIEKHYMKSASELFASEIPVMMLRGNHEYRGNAALKWLDYIETPAGKPYYTQKYGDFFFIFLDSGEDKYDGDIRNLGIMITDQYTDEEAKWLESVVASKEFKESKVRIVFSHINPDPKGWFGNKVVATKFVPTLNKAGIDLMLCGHIHKYKYYKKGATNAEFPVVCNKNRELMILDATKNAIKLEFNDIQHKAVRTLEFKTKR